MDATYYGVPSESTVSRWYEQTPENCVFGCNVLQAITHDAGPVDCGDQFLELVNVISRMKHKPGPMLFQLPYCDRKSPVRQREFIDRLRGFLPKLPAELRITLEIGNKDWVSPGIAGPAQETQGRLSDDRPPIHASPSGAHAQRRHRDLRLRVRFGCWEDRYAIEQLTKTWSKSVVDRSRELT